MQTFIYFEYGILCVYTVCAYTVVFTFAGMLALTWSL